MAVTEAEKEVAPAEADILESEDIIEPSEAGTGNVIQLNPKVIKVDPKRFQFKLDVDPKTGAGKGLDIQKWDETLAGILLVWQGKNGDYYVVNGHHRLEKAKQLGVEYVNVMVIREVDGYTEKDARLMGAKINIEELKKINKRIKAYRS